MQFLSVQAEDIRRHGAVLNSLQSNDTSLINIHCDLIGSCGQYLVNPPLSGRCVPECDLLVFPGSQSPPCTCFSCQNAQEPMSQYTYMSKHVLDSHLTGLMHGDTCKPLRCQHGVTYLACVYTPLARLRSRAYMQLGRFLQAASRNAMLSCEDRNRFGNVDQRAGRLSQV